MDTWLIPHRFKWVWVCIDLLAIVGAAMLLPAVGALFQLMILGLFAPLPDVLPYCLLLTLWIVCQLFLCYSMVVLSKLVRGRAFIVRLKRALSGTEKY
ncbi:MAG TPA: hypothetical protein VHO69_07190 [Phototrophicaceae bacterium]|nr:hypothetical protein [Phototrophicaceae bacterium]